MDNAQRGGEKVRGAKSGQRMKTENPSVFDLFVQVFETGAGNQSQRTASVCPFSRPFTIANGKGRGAQRNQASSVQALAFCSATQLMYLSTGTASMVIGMNPWFTPQISLHCP